MACVFSPDMQSNLHIPDIVRYQHRENEKRGNARKLSLFLFLCAIRILNQRIKNFEQVFGDNLVSLYIWMNTVCLIQLFVSCHVF